MIKIVAKVAEYERTEKEHGRRRASEGSFTRDKRKLPKEGLDRTQRARHEDAERLLGRRGTEDFEDEATRGSFTKEAVEAIIEEVKTAAEDTMKVQGRGDSEVCGLSQEPRHRIRGLLQESDRAVSVEDWGDHL